MAKSPGRPNQGMTETIKQRSLNVYVPTVSMADEWKAEAKKAGMPLSQFVLECVEKVRNKGGDYALPRLNVEKSLKATQAELAALQERYRILDAAYTRQEETMRKMNESIGKVDMAKGEIIKMARALTKAMVEYPYEEIDVLEVLDKMGVKLQEGDQAKLVRNALMMIEDVGMICPEHEPFMIYKWLGNRPNAVKGPSLKELIAAQKAKQQ